MHSGNFFKTVYLIEELLNAVEEISTQTKKHWWFRGHANSEWLLQTKVHRGYKPKRERYLTNLFYQESKLRHSNFPPDDDYAAWLALMQHYGLPTRLLDWSRSVIIAAYFATKHGSDISDPPPSQQDAAIWLVQPSTMNHSLGYRPVFPSLNAKSITPIVLDAFKDLSEDKKMQEKLDKSPNVVAAVPINQDMRMLLQDGTFTIHKTPTPLDKEQDSSAWLKKIVIPAKAIPTIRSSLHAMNVRLSSIFPDLDHLARDLVSMHPPKENST